MRVLKSLQLEEISDPVRSKFAMVAPILEASLNSLNTTRVERLGGIATITLADLSREFREGSGDAGICFEFAVHEAIASQHDLIYPLASEVLNDFCGIDGGSESILFGPEKEGRIPILESVQNALSPDSVVHVGNRGRPPKLKGYIPKIIKAYRRHEARNKLPRSIRGLWKADLFVGNAAPDKWVGTTVKINPSHLEGAQGLHVGIYPKVNTKDAPRKDADLNLIRLPLPYDGGFMELFYKAFNLVRAFLNADAYVPKPVALPDAEDRYITQELEARRGFPIIEVLEVIRSMSQVNLLETGDVVEVKPTASLSEEEGLTESSQLDFLESEAVSITPTPKSGC